MLREFVQLALFIILIGIFGIFFMRRFRNSSRPVGTFLPKKGSHVDQKSNAVPIPRPKSEEERIHTSINKTELVATFRGKILGIQNYASVTFSVDDFMNLNTLEYFLQEVSTGESDITPAGKEFIAQYYGLADLASRLSKEFRMDSGLSTTEEIRTWLEELVPMEIGRFIEEARGNIKAGAKLREDLLPPDEKEN